MKQNLTLQVWFWQVKCYIIFKTLFLKFITRIQTQIDWINYFKNNKPVIKSISASKQKADQYDLNEK